MKDIRYSWFVRLLAYHISDFKTRIIRSLLYDYSYAETIISMCTGCAPYGCSIVNKRRRGYISTLRTIVSSLFICFAMFVVLSSTGCARLHQLYSNSARYSKTTGSVLFRSIVIRTDGGDFHLRPALCVGTGAGVRYLGLSFIVKNPGKVRGDIIETAFSSATVCLHTSNGQSGWSQRHGDRWRKNFDVRNWGDEIPDLIGFDYESSTSGIVPLIDTCIEFCFNGKSYLLDLPYGVVEDGTISEPWEPLRSGRRSLPSYGPSEGAVEVVEWMGVYYLPRSYQGWSAEVVFQPDRTVTITSWREDETFAIFGDIRDMYDVPSCGISIHDEYVGKICGVRRSVIINEFDKKRIDEFGFPNVVLPRRTRAIATVNIGGRKSSFVVPSSLFLTEEDGTAEGRE